MNKKFSKINVIASIFAGIFISSTPIKASADWMITGLGTLGGTHSVAMSINDFGQVVGYSTIDPNDSVTRAFITGPNGVDMTDLGAFGGSHSIAYGINNSGQVVGYDHGFSSPPFKQDYYYFITGPNGIGRTSLDIFQQYGLAKSLNDSGQVVGDFGYPNKGDHHAFITGPNGRGMTDLGTLGGSESRALDVNNLGQVVGYSKDSKNDTHAFITGPNGVDMTDLGTLGGPYSYAFSINNLGVAVGYSMVDNTRASAFITDPDGISMIPLGNWDKDSVAIDINDAGQVIGMNIAGDGSAHAFFYSEGLFTDISLLPTVVAAGWTDIAVEAVNNKGQIAGRGSLNGARQQAFLLSYINEVSEPTETVPEPGTLLLVGLGLLGLYARRRSNVIRLV